MREKLVLMWQGPERYFAYWEIKGETRNLIADYLNTSWENLSLFLRVLQQGDLVLEIPVDKLANNWYFSCAGDGEFQVLLGIKDYWNTFMPLLHSNKVVLRKQSQFKEFSTSSFGWKDRNNSETAEVCNPISTYSSFSIHKM